MAAPQNTSSTKPDKYFADQFDDEEVLFVFRKHPVVMRKGLIIAMAMWLVGPVYTLALTYLRPDEPHRHGDDETLAHDNRVFPEYEQYFFVIELVGEVFVGVWWN